MNIKVGNKKTQSVAFDDIELAAKSTSVSHSKDVNLDYDVGAEGNEMLLSDALEAVCDIIIASQFNEDWKQHLCCYMLLLLAKSVVVSIRCRKL